MNTRQRLLRAALLCLALLVTATVRAQAPDRPAEGQVDPAQLKAEYNELTSKLIDEYLETGALGRDSIQAYHLLVGMAARRGVRLEKIPLRTNDERSLGPALAVARLESLGFGYDKVYRLNLRKG